MWQIYSSTFDKTREQTLDSYDRMILEFDHGTASFLRLHFPNILRKRGACKTLRSVMISPECTRGQPTSIAKNGKKQRKQKQHEAPSEDGWIRTKTLQHTYAFLPFSHPLPLPPPVSFERTPRGVPSEFLTSNTSARRRLRHHRRVHHPMYRRRTLPPFA